MSRNLDDAAAETPSQVARFESVRLSPESRDHPSDPLTFSLEAGSLQFLVGPAGVGKSAAVALLSAAGKPPSGRVEVLGHDLGALSPADLPALRRRIGILFQDQRVISDFSVFDNVALAARAAERKTAAYRDEVAQLLAWVGLSGTAHAPTAALSEAERLRLALARAMINRPELLLVDEPTARLGDKAGHGFLRLIAEINAAGTTVVIATRDSEWANTSGAPVINLAGEPSRAGTS